jgi:nucleoside-diphosphate-sugar epimerase
VADRKRILVTGAAGRIAQLVIEELATDHDIRGADLQPAPNMTESHLADMTDLNAVRRLFRDIDVVVDFANNPAGDLSWEDAYRNNILATFNSMRAAQEAGVTRYVYTSSNRATEGYEHDEPYASICRGDYEGLEPGKLALLTTDLPLRPNGPYGIGKAAAEAAGRYFSDKFGMSMICLRLGTMGRDNTGPRDQRQFATTITPSDVKRLYRCAVEAPASLRFAIYYGVSNNKWRFWDISDAQAQIGYAPRDDMEVWRGR